GKTSIFSHPVYLFLREFSLQDFRGGSDLDIVYNINDRTIDIGEQRPVWQGEAGEKTSCHQQESSASALWTDGKFIGCKKI
ncbi:hypothetical protein C9Z96_25565, partial [Escherichia coli]